MRMQSNVRCVPINARDTATSIKPARLADGLGLEVSDVGADFSRNLTMRPCSVSPEPWFLRVALHDIRQTSASNFGI